MSRHKLFDFTICVSDEERGLKATVLAVSPDIVLPVGIPKHDAMHDGKISPIPGKPTVLYAPTWRDWLQHKPTDLAMAKHFSALEELASSMPKHDHNGNKIKLIYAVHKNISRTLRAGRRNLCALRCSVCSDRPNRRQRIAASSGLSDNGLLGHVLGFYR